MTMPKTKQTANLLIAIASARIEGLDAMCPKFCAAFDRLGNKGDLVGVMHAYRNSGNFIELPLYWADEDCMTVFEMSRDEILDRCSGKVSAMKRVRSPLYPNLEAGRQ